MSDLQLLLDEYLATRRALGARLELPGRLLKRFAAFVVQQNRDEPSTSASVDLFGRRSSLPRQFESTTISPTSRAERGAAKLKQSTNLR